MQDVGLIGVGYIGKLFLDELIDADRTVTVFDINEEQVAAATEKGATEAASPAEVGRTADIIIMAVPGTPEVEATMSGPDGLVDALEERHLVIDVTTTLPETSIACEEMCDERGAHFIEAPITGGSPREGYHMMVGGTEASYASAEDVLDVICADHARIGNTGDGTIFKLALQMRYAGHHAIDAEIVEFCRDNDVDPSPLNEFLEMGVWENYFTGDFSQDIEGLGGLAIWHKDIGYAHQVATEHDTALPLNSIVHEAYKATTRRASDDEGHAAALIKYWQCLNNSSQR
ncbi:NAD(P)-dependent oxidoreductase [Saliphagus infecundisoli]|uniref:NAD(P)-dependent oxidoreductase n=1 Tax=Saliphagus infecundisoli TaxID=1849069 RepID=A0ABD5QA88_9EURY|nr:NAD(P)-binding domain-containing protein [Saliphagus infecundisoli]